MNQYPRCPRFECPFCRNESAITYEENRLYKSNCLFEKCKEILMIESKDEISAITKFKRIRVQSV
jgi:hypothetical protein